MSDDATQRDRDVTLTHLASAWADLERISHGYFTHASAHPHLAQLRDSLRPGERVDLLAPIVLEEDGLSESQAGAPVKPTGKLRVGFAATMETRVLLHWTGGGRFNAKLECASVAYDSIVAVNDLVLRKAFENNEGFEVMADRRWPIIFTNNPDAPKMDFWRSRLRRRIAGLTTPLWHGEQVLRWPSVETAEAEGFATPGQDNPKRYDLNPVTPFLDEDEHLLAALGGGRMGENSLAEGTFFLTDRRSLFVEYGAAEDQAPEEKPPARSVGVISSDDSEGLLVQIGCTDDTAWLCAADGMSNEEVGAAHAHVSA